MGTGRPKPSATAARTARAARGASLPIGSIILAVAAWQLLAKTGILPSEVPAPTAAVSALVDYAKAGQLGSPLRATVIEWLVSLAGGLVAGTVVGLAIGLSRRLYGYVEFTFEFLRPMPSVIYFPLVLLMLGARYDTAILLAAIGAFWPVLFQASYGARSVERIAVDTGRVFGLSRLRIIVRIVLPSALPYLMTGIRQAAAIALVDSVTAELLGGAPGLGAVIDNAEQNGQYGLLYGVILLVGILGVLANTGTEGVERRVLRWHPSRRRGKS